MGALSVVKLCHFRQQICCHLNFHICYPIEYNHIQIQQRYTKALCGIWLLLRVLSLA